jgi:two-component system response regulator
MIEEAAPARVLLVEDNEDDAELARRALGRCGVPVELTVAGDGVTALEMVAGAPPGELPALVLLDLKLPRVGGLGVLDRLRADPRTRTLPIVVLTTSLEERDLAEAYRLGVNSYLRKPVDFEEFTAMMREVAHYWLVMNQPPPADRE